MGPLGWQETVFIFLLALLLFGPKKLPELGRTLGKAITEFRRASSELKATFDREMSSLERETESLKEVTSSYHNEIQSASYDYNYDSSYYGGTDSSTSYDSTATDSSTVSASAISGAESMTGETPEGTVATASDVEVGQTTEPGSPVKDPEKPSDPKPGVDA
jgi:TatA/E family protein of Tat protein translocase